MSRSRESDLESVCLSDLPESIDLPVQRASSRRTSSTQLSLSLEPELLRGAPLDVALSGWCKHWHPAAKASSLASAHMLSQKVDSIDVFLSHDWETSHWTKLLTLLMVFNSRASFIACLLVSVLTCILRITQVLPDELWTACFGHIAFLVVLCFWQRIRRFSCRQQVVFLDRLCIDQSDPEVKQKGILGLGAFVLKSKKMLVLWSPRYFTRLWCTYEIGCFLSLSRRIHDIEILPVKVALILYLTAALWHALMIAYYLLISANPEGFDSTYLAGLLIPVVAMCLLFSMLLPMVNYLGMSMMQEVNELPRQLQTFQVREAKCFCCSNNHHHPQTGAELICDRELVYEGLKDLYSAKPGADCLEEFNTRVQERLGPKVFSRMGTSFPVQYGIYVVLASNLPFIGHFIVRVQKGLDPMDPMDGFDQSVWILRETLRWVQPFLSMLFSQRFAEWAWKLFNFRSSLCLSICISPAISLAVASTWISMEAVLWLTPKNSVLPVLPFFAVLLLDLYLYMDVFKSITWRQTSKPASARETQRSNDAGDASVAVDMLNSASPTAWDKWEVEEDGDTLVTWKF